MKSIPLFLLIIVCIGIQAYSKETKENVFGENTIIIDGVCIIPQKRNFPCWIKLKSCSKVKLSLAKYTLFNIVKKIYEFKRTAALLPDGILLVCFYQRNSPSKEFMQTIPDNIKVLNVFNITPFSSIPLNSEEQKNVKRHMRKWMQKHYDKLSSKELERAISSSMKKINLQCDEVTLLTPNRKICDFVKWCDPSLEIVRKKIASNRYKSAIKSELWLSNLEPAHVLLRRSLYYWEGVSSYQLSFPENAPKTILGDLTLAFSGKNSMMLYHSSVVFPTEIELEVSGDLTFKKIILKKKLIVKPKESSTDIILSAPEIRTLSNKKKFHFRVN